MIFPEHNQDSKKGAVKEKFPTIINSFSKIAGEISLQTDIRVDGTVYGIVESDNNIFIGAEGYVKGIIRAKNLVSFGRIEGTVIILGVSIFHATSSFFGKLYTREMSVYSGAYVFGHIHTCNELSPIDEAQINMDEQRTKILSNTIKSDQVSLHDFPADNKVNKHSRDSLNVVAIKIPEKVGLNENITSEEQKVIDFSSKLTKNGDFILNTQNHIIDSEEIEEIIIADDHEELQNTLTEYVLFHPENLLSDQEPFLQEAVQSSNKTDIVINPDQRIETNEVILNSEKESDNESEMDSEDNLLDETENDDSISSGKSFVFDSLLHLSSTEITEKLRNEIVELHKTSGFQVKDEQSKQGGSNLIDQLRLKLFSSKK